jgi:hypothetical protein
MLFWSNTQGCTAIFRRAESLKKTERERKNCFASSLRFDREMSRMRIDGLLMRVAVEGAWRLVWVNPH